MAKIVILGAGLTGISAAYHLEKKGFHDYLLFEKEAEVGGLCRSVTQDGFTFDYTGHLLHASNPYFKTLIADVVGLEHLNSISRRSAVYSHDTYTRYPYQAHLHGLPVSVIAECIEGFITRKRTRAKQPSFTAWVEQNFGAGFAKHFFFPYQNKIFAYDLTKISASWTGRFVPSTSLEQIIQGAIADSDTSLGYNAQFLYPKQGGIQFWIKKLAASLTRPIHTRYCVQSINLAAKTVTFTNGHTEQYEQLINTIPLDQLLMLIQDRSSTKLQSAASKLLCNSVLSVNLGVGTPLPSFHWVYYPEKQYPFYRIGFPHNLSDHVTPPGSSSLIAELAHINKPKAWIENAHQQTRKHVQALFKIEDSAISTQLNMHIKHAYVIYDFWREKNLASLHARLQQESLFSVGRYGEWKYSSMQEAVLDGKQIAERLTVMPATKIIEAPATRTKKQREKIQQM